MAQQTFTEGFSGGDATPSTDPDPEATPDPEPTAPKSRFWGLAGVGTGVTRTTKQRAQRANRAARREMMGDAYARWEKNGYPAGVTPMRGFLGKVL